LINFLQMFVETWTFFNLKLSDLDKNYYCIINYCGKKFYWTVDPLGAVKMVSSSLSWWSILNPFFRKLNILWFENYHTWIKIIIVLLTIVIKSSITQLTLKLRWKWFQVHFLADHFLTHFFRKLSILPFETIRPG
jgi:hypothetical protein